MARAEWPAATLEAPAGPRVEPLAGVAALPEDEAVQVAGVARENGVGRSRGGRKWRQTQNPRSSLNPPHFSKHAARTRPSLEGACRTIDEPGDKREFGRAVPPEGLEPPTP